MSEDLILVKRDGLGATVTLHGTARRNAVNAEVARELTRVCGDFSVGADLTQSPSSAIGPASPLIRRRAAELGGKPMPVLREVRQPTICAARPPTFKGA